MIIADMKIKQDRLEEENGFLKQKV